MMMTAERWGRAHTLDQWVAQATANVELWQGTLRLARVPNELVAAAEQLPQRWCLLALSEDWCGDAVNSLPVLHRLAQRVPTIDLRVVRRDENDDLMQAHLTAGTRSIPIVIAYDEGFQERGWWGPRPAKLQEWYLSEGRRLEKPERYRHLRTWYARDRGVSVVREVLGLLGAHLPELTSGQ